MLFNYHTHTARCNHASGTDREYVEQAISGGMKTLGFSDHAPYVFPGGTYPSEHRMKVDELFEYAESVRSLAKEYEKDIPHIYDILKAGSEEARKKAAKTLDEVKDAMKINYFSDAELIKAQSEKYS